MAKNIQRVIRETLEHIDQFQTADGLFKTFRIDYSEKACPNDFIDESKAILIDTKYDHAFILDILLRLTKYFYSQKKLQCILKRGLKLIIDEALIIDQISNAQKVRTLQWRHYDITHKNGRPILTDIDNTGRRLTVIERARKIYSDRLLDSWMSNLNLLKDEYNYKQFWPLLHPLNDKFKPCKSGDSKYSGLMTHFGHKPTNDVDPVCNIVAVYSALLFFNNNINCLTKVDIDCLTKLRDYLIAFISSGKYEIKTHEYYEPIVVAYNYSKLVELCNGLGPQFRKFAAPIRNIKSRLIHLILDQMWDGCQNVLETAFATTSLIILGYRGSEIEAGIKYVLETQKPNHFWEPYRFYRQRHPYRIFGSKGLTTAVCLESLGYYDKCRRGNSRRRASR